MAKIIIIFDEAVMAEHLLEKTPIKIGRKSTNDIVLDSLAVSGEHAAITKMGERFYVEDLGSTNGILVNGALVTKCKLKNQDLVDFGRYHLRFLQDEVFEETEPADFKASTAPVKLGGHTLMPNLKTLIAEKHEQNAPVAVKAAEKNIISEAKLVILNGPNTGKLLTLNKTLTTLGKPGVQVTVITKRAQGYFLAHIEGAAIPMVNGVVVGKQGCELQPLDVIELGGVKMQFNLA
jgi:pSer/pThr/pTyr-binding forkhead associated (FHA) protein